MHPRANGFVECMVGTAKRLMDKAEKEGKPWISGQLEYRITLQSEHIVSLMELIMRRKPRATMLPQLPSNIGTHNMHSVCKKHIKRQGNRPERECSQLDAGIPVYVKNSRGRKWQPGVVVKPAHAPDSYWVQFENSAVLRRTCSALKVRSSLPCGEVNSHQEEWRGETANAQFQHSSRINRNRNLMVHSSAK